MSTAQLPAATNGQQKTTTLKSLLMSDAVKDQIATALPKHMNSDRMVRTALTAMLKTPQLAACDPNSFMQCMLTLSQLGLEPDGRMAHLIPFNNNKANRVDCQLIVDYKGLVELANRSGKVAVIHADVVCDNDDFEYDMGEIKRHKIDFKKPRGNAYAAYARVVMKDGTSKCEVMNRDEIEAVRNRSRAGRSGPWVTDWNEMAKKTVFRRASKWLSLSPELRDAVDADDDQYEGNHSIRVDSLPDTTKPTSRTEAARRAVTRHTEPDPEPEQQYEPAEQDEQPPEAEESQDVISGEELNRLTDALTAIHPDKEDRLKVYREYGCDPLKKIWTRDGVNAIWDYIAEVNESNKQ